MTNLTVKGSASSTFTDDKSTRASDCDSSASRSASSWLVVDNWMHSLSLSTSFSFSFAVAFLGLRILVAGGGAICAAIRSQPQSFFVTIEEDHS
jgi:hypothetical protein